MPGQNAMKSPVYVLLICYTWSELWSAEQQFDHRTLQRGAGSALGALNELLGQSTPMAMVREAIQRGLLGAPQCR